MIEFRLESLVAEEFNLTYQTLADHDERWALSFWTPLGTVEVHGGTQNRCVDAAIAECRRLGWTGEWCL